MVSEEEETRTFEFDQPFQEKIAALFTRDVTFALRVKDLIQPGYFENDAARTLVRLVQGHLEVYKTVPDSKLLPMIIKDGIDKKQIRTDQVPDLKALLQRIFNKSTTLLTNPAFVSDKIVSFAKHQAMESAILESVGLLEKGQFDKINERMKQALAVGDNTESEDYDYFKEITARTQKREDIAAGKVMRHGITTGYPELDKHLYHYGWGRKELSCMMGAAKSGKSLSLGDFCKNASLAGYNVFYGSCEVAHDIIADRIDAALSDTIMNKMHLTPLAVKAAIEKAELGSGLFKMRSFASGTLKPSALRRILDGYRNEGIVFDLIVIDYADIMAPEHRSDDLRENLRTIYIDLRALAHDYNAAVLTATQTNREGAKSASPKATDVGDDWNKARTVDILIGLSATDAEKRAGEARLSWLLSRNTADGFSIRIKQDREKMQFLTKVVGIEK